MCEKHSFIQTKEGKIFNGFGKFESHTTICCINSVREDDVNKYEYKPGNVFCEYGIQGLVLDTQAFEPSITDTKAIEKYIREFFPTAEAWKTYENIKEIVLSKSVINKLVRSMEWSVRADIATYPGLSTKNIQALADDEDPDVRLKLAMNPSLTEADVDLLIEDTNGSVRVRESVAERTDLSIEQMITLAEDDESSVRRQEAKRKDLSKAIIARFVKDASWQVRINVAKSSQLNSSQINLLCEDYDDDIRELIAGLPGLKPRHIKLLSVDDTWQVRLAIAYNSEIALSKAVTVMLTNDSDPDVRIAMRAR